MRRDFLVIADRWRRLARFTDADHAEDWNDRGLARGRTF